MDITLNDVERSLLTSLLQDALGDVREEVYKSETSDYRDQLKEREEIIRGLLERFGAPATEGSRP